MSTLKYRLLLLGSTSEFAILTKLAKEMGCYVVICDGYETGVARKLADKCYTLNVNLTDEIAKICELERIDRIIGSFSDFLFECMVKISHKANLPTYISLEKLNYFRDKVQMNKMFDELELDYPKTAQVNSTNYIENTTNMCFPMIVKPISGWGSRGVRIINDYDELKYELTQGEVIIQEYNTNKAYNFCSWLVDGVAFDISLEQRDVIDDAVDRRFPLLKNIYTISDRVSLQNKLRNYAQKIADFAGIKNGPIHMQLWADEYDNIKICEVAARCFGYDQRAHYKYTDLNDSKLLLLTMFEPDKLKEYIQTKKYTNKYLSTLYVSIKDEIIADNSQFLELLNGPNVLYHKIFVPNGLSTGYLHESYYAVVILQADTKEEIESATNTFHSSMCLYNDKGENLIRRY